MRPDGLFLEGPWVKKRKTGNFGSEIEELERVNIEGLNSHLYSLEYPLEDREGQFPQSGKGKE
jgi:hypothetical protein